MSLETPRILDGLDIDYAERQEEFVEGGYPDTSEKIELADGLVLIKDDKSYPFIYFVQNDDRTISRLYVDHGEGVDLANWAIDFSPESPLFLVGANSSRDYPHTSYFEMGFKSRGVKHSSGAYTLTAFRVRYKLAESQMLIDESQNFLTPSLSLTTAEPVTTEIQETEDHFVLNLKMEHGMTEIISFPRSLSINHFLSMFLESRKNISDATTPYLQWPSLLGATFSLRSPFGEIEQLPVQ